MARAWAFLRVIFRPGNDPLGGPMFLFTKENAYGLVRTVATFTYGWLLSLVPWVEEVLADANIDESFFVLLFGGVLYQLVRWTAERVPWVGSILIFNKKPDYALDGTI